MLNDETKKNKVEEGSGVSTPSWKGVEERLPCDISGFAEPDLYEASYEGENKEYSSDKASWEDKGLLGDNDGAENLVEPPHIFVNTDEGMGEGKNQEEADGTDTGKTKKPSLLSRLKTVFSKSSDEVILEEKESRGTLSFDEGAEEVSGGIPSSDGGIGEASGGTSSYEETPKEQEEPASSTPNDFDIDIYAGTSKKTNFLKNLFSNVMVEEEEPRKTLVKSLKNKFTGEYGMYFSGLAVICCGVLFFGIMSLVRGYSYKKEVKDSLKSGAVGWVNSFVNKDYRSCDNMVLNGQYSLLSYTMSPDFETYYTIMLNALSDSIMDIKLKHIKENSGERIYTYKVKYKKFIPIEELEVHDFKSFVGEYTDGTIPRTDISKELNYIYLETYKDNCFNMSDDTETCELNLTEKDGHVDGTVEFVKTLLETDGLLDNMDKYNDTIQISVTKYLERL